VIENQESTSVLTRQEPLASGISSLYVLIIRGMSEQMDANRLLPVSTWAQMSC
jgi:hypothetical protein